MKRFLSLMAGCALLTAGAPAFAEFDKVRWKMPIAFPSKLPGLGSPSQYLAEQLKTVSDGTVQVKIFEPGKLVPPFDILSAVDAGKTEAGYTWIGYDAGSIPALPLFAAVPFGLNPSAFAAWYYEGAGDELLKEVYKNKGFNVHPELCGIIGPETAGWYSKPIKSLDDYNGLKIRFAGLGGKVLQKLGASVTMMPGGEIFQALEKGTIDATEFSQPIIDEILGFNKVVSYNAFPGWHQPFTAQYMLINGEVWSGLNASTKSLISTTCTAAVMRGLAESEYKQGAVMAGFEDKGVTAQKLPRDLLVALKEKTEEVLAEESAKDKDFAKVYAHQKKFQDKYKVWQNYGYLPADL